MATPGHVIAGHSWCRDKGRPEASPTGPCCCPARLLRTDVGRVSLRCRPALKPRPPATPGAAPAHVLALRARSEHPRLFSPRAPVRSIRARMKHPRVLQAIAQASQTGLNKWIPRAQHSRARPIPTRPYCCRSATALQHRAHTYLPHRAPLARLFSPRAPVRSICARMKHPRVLQAIARAGQAPRSRGYRHQRTGTGAPAPHTPPPPPPPPPPPENPPPLEPPDVDDDDELVVSEEMLDENAAALNAVEPKYQPGCSLP